MAQGFKIVELEGKRFEVPADATMDEIDAFIGGSKPKEGALTRMARMPKEGVESLGEAAGFPTVGKVAGSLLPDTPAGWGALAGLAGASAIPGVGQAAAVSRLLPPAIRAGGAALGAMTGSAAGGERDPTEIGMEGAKAAGANVVGEAAGRALSPVKNLLQRQFQGLKGGVQGFLDQYGDELMKIIPGLRGEPFTPTRFFDVVAGGKGDDALGAAYQAGIDNIKKLVGKGARLQSPEITDILSRYLPEKYGMQAGGRKLAASSVTGGLPITIDDAIKGAQEIGARARLAAAKPEGAILGRDMAQANTALRNAIADNLEQMSPGLGEYYKSMNTAFRRGSHVLGIVKDEQDKIFPQGTTGAAVDVPALSRAHNMRLAELRDIGAEDLAAATRRGAPPGAGDVPMKVPGAGIFFGNVQGVRGRVSQPGLRFPLYAGESGQQISPFLSGATGQRILDLIRQYREQEGIE